MDQIAVLQHLGKPKTLLKIIIPTAIGLVHVFYTREPAPDTTHLRHPLESLPRPVLVLCIARRAVGVVVTLNDLGPEDIVAVCYPETRRVVKRGLVGRRRRVVGRVERVLRVLPGED